MKTNKLTIVMIVMSIIATALSTIAITRQGQTHKEIKDTRKELGGIRRDLKFFENRLAQCNNNDLELLGIMDKKINENNEKLVGIMDIKIEKNNSALADFVGEIHASLRTRVADLSGRVKKLESSYR